MKSVGNSLKIDRQKSVLELLNTKQRVSLTDLEDMLDVSRVTIQRDLVELEGRNLIKRFHGGAMTLKYAETLYDSRVRKTINVEVKKNIVKKAAALINPHSCVGMDASSTAYYISEENLPRNITVVTCSIDTFDNLNAKGINTILTGGRLNSETRSLAGQDAVNTIKEYHFDLVLLSAEAYILNQGFYDPYEDEVSVKKAFINNSIDTVMLLDETKVKEFGGLKICSKEQVDHLVTDRFDNENLNRDFKGKIL